MENIKFKKSIFYFFVSFKLILFVLLLNSCNKSSTDYHKNVISQSESNKISYYIGWELGKFALQDSILLNADYLYMGYKQSAHGDSSFLSTEERQQCITLLKELLKKKHSTEIFRFLLSSDSI